VLASGTQDCGFAPDRRRRVFHNGKIHGTQSFVEYHNKVHDTEQSKAAIQERVTAVLLSIPKEAFANSFQKLYERCQPCVVKDDDYAYFEGQ
jgi:hypothetical protein